MEKAKEILTQGWRFLVVGSVNTGFTFLLYQLLLTHLSPSLSYSIAWIVGLVFLTIIYPKKVFVGSKITFLKASQNSIWYFCVYSVGLVSLKNLIVFGIHERIAILLTIVITTLLNFLGARWIFRK